ncbi:MAG: hypothetical protein WCH98_01405 [Verrucomicrobiota bacterium]
MADHLIDPGKESLGASAPIKSLADLDENHCRVAEGLWIVNRLPPVK